MEVTAMNEERGKFLTEVMGWYPVDGPTGSNCTFMFRITI
jgi:hypothetical protein